MDWFNYYGLIFMVMLMIPNIVYAVKCKDEFKGDYRNKAAEILEQISRWACLILMVFNIPYTWIGFWLSYGLTLYLAVNAVLTFAYCLIWIILWKKSGIVKALLLSIIPSLIFVFSSVMIASIPLFLFAVVFAVTHILISVKNAKAADTSVKRGKKSLITVTALITSFVLVIIATLGGISLQGKSNISKLENMSVMEMINYDCYNKDKKIAIAVIENGSVTYHTYNSYGEEDAMYDFEIGSVSKTFVGLLCAKAVKENRLNIKDSISKYLDLGSEKYYPTIERLLTHTSGYKAYYFESSMIKNKLAHITNDFYGISKNQILDKIKSITLEDKDYQFEYSNFGISVLGLVLEKIYKDDFVNIINDYILDELNLPNTKAAKQSGNLNNYWKWKDGDGYIPAGSVISNIEDMANYLNIYMSDKIEYSSNTWAKIKDANANNAAYEKMNIRVDSVGMTWMLDNKNGIVWHNGATTNFNGYIGFTKDKQKGVVILSNLNPNDKISMTVIGAKILTGTY